MGTNKRGMRALGSAHVPRLEPPGGSRERLSETRALVLVGLKVLCMLFIFLINAQILLPVTTCSEEDIQQSMTTHPVGISSSKVNPLQLLTRATAA